VDCLFVHTKVQCKMYLFGTGTVLVSNSNFRYAMMCKVNN
jgi:hypothetical protein